MKKINMSILVFALSIVYISIYGEDIINMVGNEERNIISKIKDKTITYEGNGVLFHAGACILGLGSIAITCKIISKTTLPPIQKIGYIVGSSAATTGSYTISSICYNYFNRSNKPTSRDFIKINDIKEYKLSNNNYNNNNNIIDKLLNNIYNENSIQMESDQWDKLIITKMGELNNYNMENITTYDLLLIGIMISLISCIFLIINILITIIVRKCINKIDKNLPFVDKLPIKNKEMLRNIINKYINYYNKTSDWILIIVIIVIVVTLIISFIGVLLLYIDPEYFISSMNEFKS